MSLCIGCAKVRTPDEAIVGEATKQEERLKKQMGKDRSQVIKDMGEPNHISSDNVMFYFSEDYLSKLYLDDRLIVIKTSLIKQ